MPLPLCSVQVIAAPLGAATVRLTDALLPNDSIVGLTVGELNFSVPPVLEDLLPPQLKAPTERSAHKTERPILLSTRTLKAEKTG